MANSTREDVDAFVQTWNELPRVTKEVYVPLENETIDISVETKQYDLRISEDIAKNIKWQQVGNQQVAHIIGSITPVLQATAQNGASTALIKPLPTLSLIQTNTESIPPTRPLHVGEIRLLELRQRLQREGYNVTLGEGVLVCDGVVRVLKDEGGVGVRIEGVVGAQRDMGRAFWDVRRAVYEGLAIV